MSTLTVQHAARTTNRSAQTVKPAKHVRALLARTGQFVVATPMLAAYLGNLIVREQFDQFIPDTVRWSLAMFDVRCISGGASSRGIVELSEGIDDYIEDRITTEVNIELKLAMEAVQHILEPVFGKQLRITGWLPGFRVAEGANVLELSGKTCPRCTINPTGYKVNSKSKNTRCLNSEDCGWTSV